MSKKPLSKQTMSNQAYLFLLLWVIAVLTCTDGVAALVLRPGLFH